MPGLAENAALVATLDLKDQLTPKSKKAIGSVNKLESSLGRLGSTAQKGIGTAASNIAKLGVVAGAAIASQVAFGLKSLADLETATTRVEGAITAMGLQGQVSAKQVADWANDIERSVDAAFDDKDITAAAETLLRFGKVTPGNLQQSLVVMTDLAVRLGGVEAASQGLARALADPTKASGFLRKAGVVLTESQKKLLASLVKTGRSAEAQEFILDQLAKTTAGAAKGSIGPYGDALKKLGDATEDAQRALAIGFLPVITKVADMLEKGLADPSNLRKIESFGRTLASSFEDLLDAAKRIPWTAIADAMRLAGTGAKAALDFFLQLPPWVQTAVLTGWGLNKLTGGALSSIVGQLASGLIKGVLGITAAVVNINAGVVKGGGVPGVPGGAAGGLGAAGTAGLAVPGVGIGIALGTVMPLLAGEINKGLENTTLTTRIDPTSSVAATFSGIAFGIEAISKALTGDPLVTEATEEEKTIAEKSGHAGYITAQSARATAVYGKRAYEEQRRGEQAEGERSRVQMAHLAQLERLGESTRDGIRTAADRQIVAQAATAEAIRNKDLSITNNLTTRIDIRDLGRTVIVSGNYGRKLPV